MLTFVIVSAFIVLALFLIIFMLKNDRGPKEPIGALWIAAGFGLAAVILAAVIEKKLIPASNITTGAPLSTMFKSFLSIGTIEECLKFIPLAIFIYHKKYFNEHTDGLIYFAIAGLGFGLPENIIYTLQYGASSGLGRLILTPFFHAAITSMVGYFLIRAKLNSRNPFSIWPILLLAIILHSLYDFGLSSGMYLFAFVSVVITLALSINSLRLFFKADDLDEDFGLAAVGHNSYCRSCGLANKFHYLYCTHCGQRA